MLARTGVLVCKGVLAHKGVWYAKECRHKVVNVVTKGALAASACQLSLLVRTRLLCSVGTIVVAATFKGTLRRRGWRCTAS